MYFTSSIPKPADMLSLTMCLPKFIPCTLGLHCYPATFSGRSIDSFSADSGHNIRPGTSLWLVEIYRDYRGSIVSVGPGRVGPI